jgi:hypothetical protein
MLLMNVMIMMLALMIRVIIFLDVHILPKTVTITTIVLLIHVIHILDVNMKKYIAMIMMLVPMIHVKLLLDVLRPLYAAMIMMLALGTLVTIKPVANIPKLHVMMEMLVLMTGVIMIGDVCMKM